MVKLPRFLCWVHNWCCIAYDPYGLRDEYDQIIGFKQMKCRRCGVTEYRMNRYA